MSTPITNPQSKASPLASIVLTAVQARTYLAALPAAPEGLIYVCIGANCWGKGPTAPEAARRARENAGYGAREFFLHLVCHDAEVDPISGTLYYDSKVPGTQVGMALFKQR